MRLGADHTSLAKPLLDLAGLSLREKDYNDAETYYRRALEIEERRLGPQNPRLAPALIGQGRVMVYKGKAKLGVPKIERALALLTANSAPTQDVAKARFALAKAQYMVKRLQNEALKNAATAADEYDSAGPSFAERGAEVRAWIQQADD